MNLAHNYPIIFWNTANLIVDSGAMNLEEEIFEDSSEDDDNEEEEKIKNSSADYGRIAAAIGKMKSRGIYFSLPNINTSKISFSPDLEKNQILYGLRGITRIGNQLIKDIILNRPYSSIEDFLQKVKVNKLQMIALIKSGAFDDFYKNRDEVMNHYLKIISEPKKRITLQNMQMLIKMDLIPIELKQEVKIFNFNKYLKKFKEEDYYNLDNIAIKFYLDNYDFNNLEDVIVNNEYSHGKIKQKIWDNIYKKEMESVRKWMKENQKSILDKLNSALLDEEKNKYAQGSISKWEMDSLSFYYHDHELNKLKNNAYYIDDFFEIDDNDFEGSFKTKDGTNIKLYKIHRIAGTVIDKDKNKSTVSLLTTTGVVIVKIWKNQFAIWDKQISEKDNEGKKHVIEKSWFTRGNKMIITGIKRDGTFIPKKYKNTSFPLFEKIEELSDDGFILSSKTERAEIEEG